MSDTRNSSNENESETKGAGVPYYTLERSVEVGRVIYEQAGGSCNRPQLASLLGYSGIRTGSFLSRVTAAKGFTIITQEGDQLKITDRGRSIVAPILPVDGDRARLEAFLAVPLFKRVFDTYNGQLLPPEAGLKNLLIQNGVTSDRATPTLAIMLDSAEQAGLFKMTGNRSRMVAPLLGAASVQPVAVAVDAPSVVRASAAPTGNMSVIKSNGVIPAGILGLLEGLPAGGTVLSKKKRDALIAAFTKAVEWIYPDAEEPNDTLTGG